MAFKLAWSKEALEDIESIASYIEKDSPVYAKSVVSKFLIFGVWNQILNFVCDKSPQRQSIQLLLPNPGAQWRILHPITIQYRMLAIDTPVIELSNHLPCECPGTQKI